MKKSLSLIFISFLLINCNKANETIVNDNTPITNTLTNYPPNMEAIFAAHGGIDTWNEMNNICFTVAKDPEETHTIDLPSRKTRIDSKDFVLGFNGTKVWLLQDSIGFNPERARFYHNLLFYFYAMSFVLGDDGITYEETLPLEKDGISYPGTKISFAKNIGDALDDNYILYSHPETNQMEWLAYTVTYNGEGPSTHYNFIKYEDWQEVNGLKLPSNLQWYTTIDGFPTEMKSSMKFIKPSITEAILNDELFSIPENATYVE